jgi:hypothetical protein
MRTTASGTRSPLSARLVGFDADRALLALRLPAGIQVDSREAPAALVALARAPKH